MRIVLPFCFLGLVFGEESPLVSQVRIPRIDGEYVHVYRPKGDVFPGPDAAELVTGRFYEEWVPNDHTFARDRSGRWHAFGITHPLTHVDHIHAGEHLLFHAVAPEGSLVNSLTEGSWEDLAKVLPVSERPGELEAIHAPWILRRNGLYHMVYGPTPMRFATSEDLQTWTPRGELKGAPEGRDPQVFQWNGRYYLIACGVHDVRVSTSHDFENWTEHGALIEMPEGIDPESPSVVRYNDMFYLFVCGWDGVWDKTDVQGAYQHKTYVYHSNDPLKFELKNQVAVIDAHAPEIFQDEVGDWFISSAEWPKRGVSIARLAWDKAVEGE
ncbi:MAG: family 43 glycosylhydrolase [Verrucomicrobiota bacterium]